MAGILFIVNVPKKEYENQLKKNNIPNLNFEKERYEIASKVIHELKEKHLGSRTVSDVESLDSKCKSTDCIHRHSECSMNKYNSTSTITEIIDGQKCYMKSWNEIKQVIRSKKNKLKISRPLNGVDILEAFRCDTALEIILSDIIDRLEIKNATWTSTKGDKFWQVIFSLESGKTSEELLEVLKTFGIGSRHQSSVSLLPCALYYKSNDRITDELQNDNRESVSSTAWTRFSSSVRARTNLAKVLYDVKSNAALTFDWLFMLLVAALVAAIGLVENSTVILVASMLISPLMGPITAGTLGTVLQDRSLQLLGLKNEFLGLFLSLVMGFLVGLTICALDERYGVIEEWPTDEMLSRCTHRSLWIGILVAIPSGAGCALAVLGDYTASLVGVAISASLLPPAVNAGLLWSMALTRLIVEDSEKQWLVVQPSELALLGTASLCLTFVNIVCIYLSGITVYKVKEVSPFARRDISWWSSNTSRFNISRQTRDRSLDWDAYTKWSTNSMENKDHKNDIEHTDANKCATPIHSNTNTFRNRPSFIHNLRAQNIEAYCNNFNLQLQEKFQDNSNLEKHIESISDDVQSHNEDNKKNTYTAHHEENNRNNIQHSGYYNLAYETNKQTDSLNRPTIEPSLSFTVDNKRNGIINQTVFNI